MGGQEQDLEADIVPGASASKTRRAQVDGRLGRGTREKSVLQKQNEYSMTRC